MKNLNENLILEEYRQRYEQYRMHNENRNKYIHFYFIFYFAFWGLVGFLFKPEIKCFLAHYGITIETFLAFAFILHAIFGSIFFLSIISFRQIQSCEGKTLNMIRKLSNTLTNEKKVKYPWDRELNCTGITVTSQTPLVFLIFMLNSISAILSLLFFCRFCISSCWQVILCCISSLVIFNSAYFWIGIFSGIFLMSKFAISNFCVEIIYSYFVLLQIVIWICMYFFLKLKEWKPKMVCWQQINKKLGIDC